MITTLKDMDDCGDRLEASVSASAYEVTVSIDKPDIDDETASKLLRLVDSVDSVLQAALEYFELHKQRYSVGYIDDLSEPLIIVGKSFYSVYWSSEKGERHGECVVGIDFHADKDIAFQLTIGD